MASDGSVPWYNRPAREFPAKVWLEGHYPFSVSTATFARLCGNRSIPTRRRFPALVWWEAQQIGDFNRPQARQTFAPVATAGVVGEGSPRRRTWWPQALRRDFNRLRLLTIRR